MSEDALTTWYSMTLSQQPREGYPKQPAKNNAWLTNPGQYNRDTTFNLSSFTFTVRCEDQNRLKNKIQKMKQQKDISRSTNPGFIQFYFFPISSSKNTAVSGTTHSDFTRDRKLRLNLSRSYWR